MKTWIIISIISSLVLGSLSGIVYAQSIDNAGRREYVYCPIDPSLLSARTTYEINGCPTVRIYVDNWNNLPTLDKTTIDTQLRNSGFKDVSEVSILVK